MAWRCYTADALRLLTENTAVYAGQMSITNRFSEIIEPKTTPRETPEQVLERFKSLFCRKEED